MTSFATSEDRLRELAAPLNPNGSFDAVCSVPDCPIVRRFARPIKASHVLCLRHFEEHLINTHK